jgi:amidase
VRSLEDVVAFNEEHHDQELRWHNQGLLEAALQPVDLTGQDYLKSVERSDALGRAAFAEPMRRHRLDAIFAPTFRRPWLIDLLDGDDPLNGNGAAGPANAAGYPHITVPAGYADGLPIGASFMAPSWQEPRLLRYAYAFEQAIQARHAPQFRPNEAFVPRAPA